MTDVQLLIFLKCLTLDLDDRIICILYQFQNNFSNFFSNYRTPLSQMDVQTYFLVPVTNL